MVAELRALHVFEWDGGVELFVACDLDDAWAVALGHWGGVRSDYGDNSDWTRLPDDRELTLVDDLTLSDERRQRCTQTCAEWANSNGRGFLAGTEY